VFHAERREPEMNIGLFAATLAFSPIVLVAFGKGRRAGAPTKSNPAAEATGLRDTILTHRTTTEDLTIC
jgi:hypothetical protein